MGCPCSSKSRGISRPIVAYQPLPERNQYPRLCLLVCLPFALGFLAIVSPHLLPDLLPEAANRCKLGRDFGAFRKASGLSLRLAESTVTVVLLALQEKDGSWWDYPLYDYHQPYGTAFALMSLQRCR